MQFFSRLLSHRKGRWQFVSAYLAILLMVEYAFSEVATLLFPNLSLPQESVVLVGELGWMTMLITSLIVAPIVETAIFQHWLFDKKLNRFPPIWASLISAILFSAAHLPGHAMLFFQRFIIGTFFNMCFFWSRKISNKVAFYDVVLLHLLRNAVALGVVYLTIK